MLQLRSESSNKPPLWLVGPLFRIGSQRDSQIRLTELDAIALELAVVDQDVTIKQLSGQVKVNGEDAVIGTKLNHDDALEIESFKWRVFDPKSLSKANTVLRKPIVLEWHLVGMSPEIKRKKFDLKTPMTIGRAPECEISLNHQQLSRQHAKLSPSPSGVVVEDLGSSNGTYVNGEKVSRALVTSGMELRLDTLVFKIMGPVSESTKGAGKLKDDLDATKMRGAAPVVTPRKAKPSAVKPAPAPVSPAVSASPPSEAAHDTSPKQAAQRPKASPLKSLLILVLLGALGYAGYYFSQVQV